MINRFLQRLGRHLARPLSLGSARLPHDLTVDQYAALLDVAMMSREFERALELTSLLRGLAPGSVHVVETEACAHAELGHTQEAYQLYRKAHEVGSKDAAFAGLCVALDHDDMEAAREFIACYLTASLPQEDLRDIGDPRVEKLTREWRATRVGWSPKPTRTEVKP